MHAYHITHHRNLESICAQGLVCDAAGPQQPAQTGIGNDKIKRRRMAKVIPGTDTTVGQYVPFYFCPRSVMLYTIHKRNDELAYKDGQEPIVHLVFDVAALLASANAANLRWYFTDCNASAGYASFYDNITQLEDLDHQAIAAAQWTDERINERNKQSC
jgi:hypothetical protein